MLTEGLGVLLAGNGCLPQLNVQAEDLAAARADVNVSKTAYLKAYSIEVARADLFPQIVRAAPPYRPPCDHPLCL